MGGLAHSVFQNIMNEQEALKHADKYCRPGFDPLHDACLTLAAEVRRLRAAGNTQPTPQQVSSACMSYRHDYGLMNAQDRSLLEFSAREWLHAWRKEAGAVPFLG
jgi:hypothetical protein